VEIQEVEKAAESDAVDQRANLFSKPDVNLA